MHHERGKVQDASLGSCIAGNKGEISGVILDEAEHLQRSQIWPQMGKQTEYRIHLQQKQE